MVLYTVSTVPSTDVWIGLCPKTSNSQLTGAIYVPDMRKCEWSKLGKDVHFYYSGSLGLFHGFYFSFFFTDTLTSATANVTYQILHGFSNVFRHDILVTHFERLVNRNVGQDLVSGTQRFATHSFAPEPQEGMDPAEQTAGNLPIPCPHCR